MVTHCATVTQRDCLPTNWHTVPAALQTTESQVQLRPAARPMQVTSVLPAPVGMERDGCEHSCMIDCRSCCCDRDDCGGYPVCCLREIMSCCCSMLAQDTLYSTLAVASHAPNNTVHRKDGQLAGSKHCR
jgi:hypothetical protein